MATYTVRYSLSGSDGKLLVMNKGFYVPHRLCIGYAQIGKVEDGDEATQSEPLPRFDPIPYLSYQIPEALRDTMWPNRILNKPSYAFHLPLQLLGWHHVVRPSSSTFRPLLRCENEQK